MEEERTEVLASFNLEILYSDEGQYSQKDLDDMALDLPDEEDIAIAIAEFIESRFDVKVTANWTGDLRYVKGKL